MDLTTSKADWEAARRAVRRRHSVIRQTIAGAAIVFVVAAYGSPLLNGQGRKVLALQVTPSDQTPGAVGATGATGPLVSTPTNAINVVKVDTTGAPTPDGTAAKPVAVTQAPSPAGPQNPLDMVIWALGVSMALRQIIKSGKLPFLNSATEPQIKAAAGFVAALCTAAGIHLVVHGSFFTPDGVSATVTGLSFDAVKDVVFQWVSQQAWYEGLVKPRTA